MTLLNLFPLRAGAGEASSEDRSILLLVVLLLGLVFAPVIGLHVAAVALGPPAAASSPDNLAHHTVPAKPTRG
ncbi:hypothetical protein [Microvirga sp. CF3016]|uniref:hypothetical protein n=1 Tax=Microvirga sp. CF3016 TaxID=3110181 RepID=UPI002E771F77|nr:hypothetical protein [Microvirga sp. CF3016]MEE1613678.1 hypothetical protein [Microvirga sp. CF3016]